MTQASANTNETIAPGAAAVQSTTQSPSQSPSQSPAQTPTLSGRSGILFTAFEPSGDDHASIVIAELKRLYPSLPIYAWGGRKMEAAGATIVERTGQSAVMGIPGLGKILEHVRINHRIEDWLETHRVAMHIPVDSPDANFPICAMAKDRGMRVVHLVAPQLWAWREGRIKKLRRLTDLVLCLLPFEEQWFMSRGVPARFVGHPLFSETIDHAGIASRVDALSGLVGDGSPRIALMPGSRPVEIRRSLPPLIDAFVRLRADFPNLRAVFPVTTPAVRDHLLELIPRLLAANGAAPASSRAAANAPLPAGLSIVVGDTDSAVAWCDLAIVASGTVTLQVARQNKPMVTFYCFSRFWKAPYSLFGRLLFKTRYFTLPNLIAGAPVVPELVPHFGTGQELAVGVYRLLRQPNFADDQRAALAGVCAKFANHHAGTESALAIGSMLGLTPATVGANGEAHRNGG